LAFLRWQKDVGFKPREVESLVYSLKFGVAGHPDAIGTIKQSVGIFDWKLGDVFGDRIKYQLSVYGFSYLEMHPDRTLNRGFRGVHLDPLKATYKELIMSFEEGQHWFHEFIRMKLQIGIL